MNPINIYASPKKDPKKVELILPSFKREKNNDEPFKPAEIRIKSYSDIEASPEPFAVLHNGYKPILNNANIGTDLSESSIEKPLFPRFTYTKSPKLKKKYKLLIPVKARKNYEKIEINIENNLDKINKIIRISTNRTPDLKRPKYIKHDSHKAGFFLSRIDKVLSKIRLFNSKINFNSNALTKTKIKMMLY